MAQYVENETYIPSDDMKKIKARLIDQINSMNEAELRIVAKSEASFKAFVADVFKAVAQLFGYIVGTVYAFGRDIVKAVGKGFGDGWNSATS